MAYTREQGVWQLPRKVQGVPRCLLPTRISKLHAARCACSAITMCRAACNTPPVRPVGHKDLTASRVRRDGTDGSVQTKKPCTASQKNGHRDRWSPASRNRLVGFDVLKKHATQGETVSLSRKPFTTSDKGLQVLWPQTIFLAAALMNATSPCFPLAVPWNNTPRVTAVPRPSA